MKLIIANTVHEAEYETQEELNEKIKEFGLVPEDQAIAITAPAGIIFIIKRTIN